MDFDLLPGIYWVEKGGDPMGQNRPDIDDLIFAEEEYRISER